MLELSEQSVNQWLSKYLLEVAVTIDAAKGVRLHSNRGHCRAGQGRAGQNRAGDPHHLPPNSWLLRRAGGEHDDPHHMAGSMQVACADVITYCYDRQHDDAIENAVRNQLKGSPCKPFPPLQKTAACFLF